MEKDEIERLENLAHSLLSSSDYLKAAQVYQKLLEETKNFIYKFRLFDCYLQLGNRQAAEKYVISILDDFPGDDEVTLHIATTIMYFKDWEKTKEILMSVDPEKRTEVNFFLGFTFFKLKNYQKAEHHFNLYLKKNDNPNLENLAIYYLGVTYFYQNRFDEAISRFKEVESSQTDNLEFDFYFASTYRMLGMLTHASHHIMKALRFSYKRHDILIEAAKIYNKLEQYEKAEEFLRSYSEISKNTSNDYFLTLAETCIGLKNFKDAEIAISLIDESETGNPEYIAIKSKLSKMSGVK